MAKRRKIATDQQQLQVNHKEAAVLDLLNGGDSIYALLIPVSPRYAPMLLAGWNNMVTAWYGNNNACRVR